MPKQIKLGFDKGPARPTTVDQILVDVRGNRLRDADGNFLYTESTGYPESFFLSDKSTSVFINNEDSTTVSLGKAISVREQFPEVSEVSSSMLGVPRLGKQQSLLADVSIYGLNENIWEFYNSPNPFQPVEWTNRLNRRFGNRGNPSLKEFPEEQALGIEVFPTAWTFPFGPRWSGTGRFNANLFRSYRNFISLGNDLYARYTAAGYGSFANNKFLAPRYARVESNDVTYNDSLDLAFEYIEQWTATWMDIRDGILEDPLFPPGTKLNAARINALGLNFAFSETRPGYSTTNYRYCQLQSKESFRYQPGAISGFTFGVKLNADPGSLTNVVEWGCANETDQLMFQVRGSQFAIVRRSTTKLSNKNLELMGMLPQNQIEVQAPNPFERGDTTYTTSDLGLPPKEVQPLWELRIQNDDFNGDPLNGTGRSGYNISFNEVTMYKIEYSWYGAIGAKFYAYVPVGNDEARWVLLHTLIIENTLDNPSLQNPFMHFRYSIYLNDTSTLREPMYLYKYGASYYIDGDDEGSYSYRSYKMPIEKNITSAHSRPVISFLPKPEIKNRDGVGTKNQKNFYIESMSVSSDRSARVDILECEGCPGGHGYFYAPSLQNGQKGIEDLFRIDEETGDLKFADPSKRFTEKDDNKKIITPGIYSTYVFTKPDPERGFDDESMLIRKNNRQSPTNRNEIIRDPLSPDDVTFIDGEQVSLFGLEFSGRLTGYDDIIASTIPLSKSNIKVQFLNPIQTEVTGQWADFLIGITSKVPSISNIEVEENGETFMADRLVFGGVPLDIESEIYGEFQPVGTRRSPQGVDISDTDSRIGSNMEQDFRLRRPKGGSTGICSELNFEIAEEVYKNVIYTTVDPSGELPGQSNFLVFQTRPPELQGGGFGIWNGNIYADSGYTFVSDAKEYEVLETGARRYVVAISGPVGAISAEGIALNRIRCFGRYIDSSRVSPFTRSNYYLFVAMRDNARINNIVLKEFDSSSSFSYTPVWIKDETCNIESIPAGSGNPPTSVIDKLSTSNEYIGLDGQFYMGGTAVSTSSPANFIEKNRLDSIQYDDQTSLPLRPSSLITSVYVGQNKPETIEMDHIFGINRYKLTKGSFNNKVLSVSSIVTETEEQGNIVITVSGKEQ